MRVLWVCNIMLPVIAQALGEEYSVREGWLSGILGRLLEADGAALGVEAQPGASDCAAQPDGRRTAAQNAGVLELGICFPKQSAPADYAERLKLGSKGKEIACYGFTENLTAPETYEAGLEGRFAEILADFQPDLVHIFGTEFGHAYACAKVWNRPERTLLGIQGLCSSIAENYYADLPEHVVKSVTLRDVLRKDSIRQQQAKFEQRAAREEQTIRLAGHITGRTEFDRRVSLQKNPGAAYHFMSETMRPSFYEGNWSLESCDQQSIFISQGDYPLKGFHYLLQAMPEILKEAPDARIKVAGNSILGTGGVKSLLKLPAYGKYLRSLIKKHGLEGKVQVLGRMQEGEMKREYLSCHVFVCPSAVENSPNSVAEAQLLGVPVAASNAGGIPSVVEPEKSGLLFKKGDAHELAQAVLRIMKDDAFARRLSESARKAARTQYDGAGNFERLLEIYGEIMERR